MVSILETEYIKDNSSTYIASEVASLFNTELINVWATVENL